MSKTAYVVIAFLAVLLIAAVYLYFDSKKTSDSVVIAEISTVTGEVSRREPRSTDEQLVSGPSQLHAQEVLATGPSGKATLQFQNGLELLVKSSSRVIAEFDASRTDKINVTILSGGVEFAKEGRDDAVAIYKDGVQLTKDAPAALSPLIITAEEAAVGEDANVSLANPDESAATPSPTPKTDATADDDKTLSNQEIERAITAKRGLFQRCYLSFLQRTKETAKAGRIVIGFVIENDGHVSSQKLVQSPFEDQALNNCILEVLGRISFGPFEGAKIAVSEFPLELQ